MAARSLKADTTRQLNILIEGTSTQTKQLLVFFLESLRSHSNAGAAHNGTILSYFSPLDTTSDIADAEDVAGDSDIADAEDAGGDSDIADAEDIGGDSDIADAEDVGGGSANAGEKRKRAVAQRAETHVKVCIIFDKQNGVAYQQLVERYKLTYGFIKKIIFDRKATLEKFKEEISVMRLHQDNTAKIDIMQMDWKFVGKNYHALQKNLNNKYMHELNRTFIRCGHPPS